MRGKKKEKGNAKVGKGKEKQGEKGRIEEEKGGKREENTVTIKNEIKYIILDSG